MLFLLELLLLIPLIEENMHTFISAEVIFRDEVDLWIEK
jgi:hypothetical protein